MKAAILAFWLVILTIGSLSSQKLALGIHAVNPITGMKCRLRLQLINTREYYCILETPIVTTADFVSISEIYEDPEQNLATFDLTLTPTAAEKIHTLSTGFRDIQLAMVMDSKIISLLNSKGNVVNGVVRFSQEGSYGDLRRLRKKIYKALEKK